MSFKMVVKGCIVLCACLLLASCAQKGVDLPQSSHQPLDGGNYVSKVDNFLVILDSSSSMYDNCNGYQKFDIARRVASDINITLPELGQTAGLRTLGHDNSVSSKPTALFYGMAPYTTSGFAGGLEQVKKPGGSTPLHKAINASIDDYAPLSGARNALIIISDGLETGNSSAEKAQMLKDRYGTSICIYTVQVGDAPEGEALLKELASIGNCGFFTTADQLTDPSGMRNFIENVFLSEKKAEKPAPAPAPAPAPEPAAGAPLDSDNDGVIDDEDQCPGTPEGARVNHVGCWVLEHVLFDYDKSVIKPEAYPLLDEVIVILNQNPEMKITLQGHTDNIGTLKYNMGLSMRRAEAVKAYLVNNGISAHKISTVAFAFKKPIALNGTEAGRALNRRVEIHPD